MDFYFRFRNDRLALYAGRVEPGSSAEFFYPNSVIMKAIVENYTGENLAGYLAEDKILSGFRMLVNSLKVVKK